MMEILLPIGIIAMTGFVLSGIRVIRPTERGLIERMGNYNRFANAGFNWIIPIIDRMVVVNITEMMVDAQPQEIITQDKLNAKVDAQVYFKIKASETEVKASQYNVNDVVYQIVNLARTTLRNIIGTLSLEEANSERDKINKELLRTLQIETKSWGIDVVRTELKEIEPPKDVQDTMNKVVKSKNEKISAIDFATAVETEADGLKRSEIKKAEGIRQSKILMAEGEAQAIIKVAEARAKEIEAINQSIQKNFKAEAITYKKLETAEKSLRNSTKFVIDTQKNITNVISDVAGVTPIKNNNKE